MKTLTKVKLINWHTFSNEEFEIYKNALITGENGTGKSTNFRCDSICFNCW